MKKKDKKKALVLELRDCLLDSEIVVVASCFSLKANRINWLRRQIYQSGGVVRVVKNSLLKLAVGDTQHSEIRSYCKQSILLVLSKGKVIETVGALFKFCSENTNLIVQVGSIDGQLFSPDALDELAGLGSMVALKAKLAYAIYSPIVSLARSLSQPCVNLVSVLSKKSKL